MWIDKNKVFDDVYAVLQWRFVRLNLSDQLLNELKKCRTQNVITKSYNDVSLQGLSADVWTKSEQPKHR